MKRLLVDLLVVPYSKIKEGFFKVVSFKALRDMTPRILENVICGVKKVVLADQIDLDWLKSITMCSDQDSDQPEPITKESHLWPRFEMMWNVLKSFSEDQLCKYLQFVTGSSRINKYLTAHAIFFDPMQGIIPRGHTCYNTIDLGTYDSEDDLRKKLLFAIEHSGFMEDGFSNGKKIHEDYDIASPHRAENPLVLRHTISSSMQEFNEDTGGLGFLSK